MNPRKLLPALLAFSLGLPACLGSSQLGQDPTMLGDERANPYSFNRSVAMTLLRTSQPLEASRVIRRMLEMKPKSLEAHCMLGRAYIDMQQFDLAARTLHAALALDPNSSEAHSLLGVMLDLEGRHGEALASHRKAIQLSPKSAPYYNNLGFNLYLQDRFAEAVTAYEGAIERDAGDHRVHNNLGFAYAKLAHFDRAAKHFQLAGPPAQASNNLGYVYESRGEDRHAFESYYLAVRQDPTLVPARANLERICAKLGVPVPEVPWPKRNSEPLPPPDAAARVLAQPAAAANSELETQP